ncbi:MAG: GNAT family N-acetyltransferase [Myxococcota bacterium]|nr:GNAT family N-acetyltransferase [Myxococcota bacterium]
MTERRRIDGGSVRPVRAHELREFYAVLARAFEDDPLTGFLFPDSGSRFRRLTAFYRWMIPTLVAHGRMETDEEIRGGAVWQAPNPPSPGSLQLLSTMLRAALALRGRARAGMALGRTLEAVHEQRPHWYLAVLGTAPEYQARGVGSALIAPVLERCDREGVLAYLESSKEVNIPFYERHGFEVRQEVRVPDGPVVWPMLRRPRAVEGRDA